MSFGSSGGRSFVSFSAIDLLARLQLDARRRGMELRLRSVAPALRELIAFAGLDEALRVEPLGQAEPLEQRAGVDEERELGDTVR
jgi:anti-anti-sigma regulatory factor